MKDYDSLESLSDEELADIARKTLDIFDARHPGQSMAQIDAQNERRAWAKDRAAYEAEQKAKWSPGQANNPLKNWPFLILMQVA